MLHGISNLIPFIKRKPIKGGGLIPPKWFEESCICWYDPKRQGLTNEEIIASIAPEGKGYFILKDFTKNKLDARASGFNGTEDSGMSTTTNKGALIFDGGDDYAISDNQPVAQGTIMSNIEAFTYVIDGSSLRLGGAVSQPLYQFLRFNRILTQEEMDWVRENIMGEKPSLLLEDGTGDLLLEDGSSLLLEKINNYGRKENK